MTTADHQLLILKTPHGHEVLAEYDGVEGAVRAAKVVDCFTGSIRPAGDAATENLTRALRAKQVYAHALEESRAVEETLMTFGLPIAALGREHPALMPYWQELAQHNHIAEDMIDRAHHFEALAMQAIDTLMGD